MWKLSAISAVGTLAGYAVVHFVFFATPTPAPESPEPPIAAPRAEPVVLSHVVDVTDLNPLLDSVPHPKGGVPFDAVEPISFTVPKAAPPIPPAAD